MRFFTLSFLRLLRIGLKFKKTVAAGSFLALVLLAQQIPHIKTFYSTDELQEDKIVSLQEWRDFKVNFGEGQSSLFLIAPVPPRIFFSEEELCFLQTTANEIPALADIVKSVQTPFDVRQSVLDDQSRLLSPLMVKLDCSSPQKSAAEMLAQFQKLDVADLETLLFAEKRNDISMMVSYEAAKPDEGFPVGKIKQVWQTTSDSLSRKVDSIKVFAVGGADYQLWVAKARGNTAWVYVAVLLSIALGLRLLLGTWISGIIYLSGLSSCLIFIYGFKVLLGSPTDLLSDTMVPLLALATLEDFVFVSYLQVKEDFHWRKSLRRLLIPGFWTSFTTFIGFGSLVISDLHIIQRLGFWAACGCMAEWLVVFLFTPVVLSLFFKKRTWVDPRRSLLRKSPQMFSAVLNAFIKLLNPLCKVSFVILPMALFLSPPLRVVDSLEEVFSRDHPFSEGLRYLQETRGWKGRIELTVREGFPAEKLDSLLKTLLEQGLISKFDSGAKAKGFIAKNLPAEFLPVAHRLAESSDYVSSFYGLDGNQRVSLFLKDNSTETFAKLKTSLIPLCPEQDCHLVGSLYTKSDFTHVVAETFLESSILSLFLIVTVLILLSLAMKRAHEALPMILASLWAPFSLLVLIKTSEISINFITCIVITVLVGLAGDNVIQFLFADKKSIAAGISSRQGAAASCFLLTAVVSLLFLLAPFQPVRTMGALTSIGFIAILIGDILVLNILLHVRLQKLPKN